MRPSFRPGSSPSTLGSRVLLLAVLCAVFAAALCLAQTPVAASPPPAPATTAEFLASLSAASPGSAGLQTPAPVFLQATSCTGSTPCPPGTLCCKACAYPGCTAMACLTPIDGHCPLLP
jgi:hypothetical protein